METTTVSTAATGDFYVLGPDVYRDGPGHGLVFANLSRLLLPPRKILRPAEGGFPVLREKPRLVQDRANGRALSDLEATFSGYWLVSQRLKDIFEKIDADGFAFAACDVELSDGPLAAPHYLCDVLRVVDALDESRSKLKIEISDEYAKGKFYYIGNGASLAFKSEVIGDFHAFRTPYSGFVFCDRLLHDALSGGDLTGVSLEDASDY